MALGLDLSFAVERRLGGRQLADISSFWNRHRLTDQTLVLDIGDPCEETDASVLDAMRAAATLLRQITNGGITR